MSIILKQLLMKQAVKEGAKRSGIMTINKNIVRDVEKLYQKYLKDALAQGVDLDILSPEQLKMIVAMNQPKPPKVFSGQEAMDQLNKLFPKKGEVVDMTGKKLDAGKPIIGGTQDDTVSGIMTQVDERMTGINKANKKLGELLEERKKGGSPKALREKQLIEAIQGSEGFRKEGFLTKLGRIGGELSILKDPATMALIRQYEKSQEPLVEETNGAVPAGPTPAGTTTGVQGQGASTKLQQLRKEFEAYKAEQTKKASPTEPSPEVVAAEKAVTDLIEGIEIEGTAQKETLDVTNLTDLYKEEVDNASTAISVAKTAITKAIEAQLKHIEEQEDRIPELARVASLTAPATGGQATRYLTRKIKREEIALNMRNKISGKKQALSVIKGNMASLEKQAQEARRNQNVQALMDIERQQIQLIAELQKQTTDSKRAAQLAVAEANLKHAHKIIEIRQAAELGGGVNSSAGERIMADIIEELSTEFLPGTRIANPNYIADEKKRANEISKIRKRAAGIGVTAAADNPESILATEDTLDAIEIAAERGWWDALRNIMPIFDGQRKFFTADFPQGAPMTFEKFYIDFKNTQTTKQRAPDEYMGNKSLKEGLNKDLKNARNLTIEELYYIWTQAAKV